MLYELGHSLDVGRLLELIQCFEIQKLYSIDSYSIVGYTVGRLQTTNVPYLSVLYLTLMPGRSALSSLPWTDPHIVSLAIAWVSLTVRRDLCIY
jgi:hypothetical protein